MEQNPNKHKKKKSHSNRICLKNKNDDYNNFINNLYKNQMLKVIKDIFHK